MIKSCSTKSKDLDVPMDNKARIKEFIDSIPDNARVYVKKKYEVEWLSAEWEEEL